MNRELNFKNQFGLSLIELLVAVTIFTVVILSATEIFKVVLEGQRNAVAAQNVQENVRYVFETIGKEIRMAQKSDNNCEASGIYKVYNTTNGNTVLHFKNKDGKCVSYYLNNNRMMIDRGDSDSAYVTPNEIKVSNLKFIVTDDLIGGYHSLQPKVTLVMDIQNIGKAMNQQNIKVEVTISSRYYE